MSNPQSYNFTDIHKTMRIAMHGSSAFLTVATSICDSNKVFEVVHKYSLIMQSAMGDLWLCLFY